MATEASKIGVGAKRLAFVMTPKKCGQIHTRAWIHSSCAWFPPPWQEDWVRGSVPADTPRLGVPTSMEWQRLSGVLGEETGTLLYDVTRSL